MNTENIILENGLNTLFIDAPHSNVTTAQIWFKAGSSLENTTNRGIAHFLEHMFFKGTKKYPEMMIAKTVESYGGEINAFISFDYTCYYINGPATDATTTVDVLMDMVSNPLFKSEDIEPEKGVVFEEYRRSIDNQSQFNFFKIQKNCFPKSYASPILGNEKTIKAFNREQLIEFRTNNYNNQNALLVVAGNLSKRSQIEKIINKYKLPNGNHSTFPKFKLKSKPSIAVHETNVNQSVLTLVIQAPDYKDPKSPIEDLAINCLCFGDISPLYKKLVSQKALASSTSGSTMFFAEGGCHFIRLSFPTENTKDVLEYFHQTIEDVFKNPFSSDDIDRIRNQYIASKVYEKESIESFAFSLGHGFAQSGDIHCEDEFIQAMKKVSKKQVHQKLIEIFKKNVHMTLQVPKGSKNESTKKELEKLNAKLHKSAMSHQNDITSHNATISNYDPKAMVIEIDKGIKLFYRHNDLTPTYSFNAYIKGGQSDESLESSGIYNLIAKNLIYGHKKKKYDELKSELEKKSTYINGFSGRNAYGLTLHGLSEFSEESLEHFLMLLLWPSMPSSFFKIEKELIKRTLHIQQEDPVKKCFSEFNKLVFKNHPYSWDIIGNNKSISSLTRKKVLEKHQENLNQKEIVFSYCGDQDLDFIVGKIKELTHNAIKRSRVRKAKKNTVRPIKVSHQKFFFDREQTHIMIGKPAFKSGSTEDLYLKIFSSFLSGQSSELFLEVRDRQGLCYAVQVLQNSALEASYWGIYIGSGRDKKDKAISAIKDILKKYQQKGLKKSEFNTTIKMIQGQNLLNIQTNEDFAHYYSIPVLHNLGLDYQHESFDKIKNMKVEDFNAFLSKFLIDKWNIVEVGRD